MLSSAVTPTVQALLDVLKGSRFSSSSSDDGIIYEDDDDEFVETGR